MEKDFTVVEVQNNSPDVQPEEEKEGETKMNWLKGLFVKLVGKKITAQAAKWGISKTKIIAIVAALVYLGEKTLPAFGVNVTIPPDVFELLAALGLWTLRDGIDTK